MLHCCIPEPLRVALALERMLHDLSGQKLSEAIRIHPINAVVDYL